MTIEKLVSWIREGRGVGLLDAYQPWIQITKRNTSSESAQTPVHMPGLTRLCHYLSLAERKLVFGDDDPDRLTTTILAG